MEPEERTEEARGEVEREKEEPEEKPELGEEDEAEPWAKFSTGRDPDE